MDERRAAIRVLRRVTQPSISSAGTCPVSRAAVAQPARVGAAERRADLALEVAERVAVLGEEDELLAR